MLVLLKIFYQASRNATFMLFKSLPLLFLLDHPRLGLKNVANEMGQSLCVCSRGSMTIDNKKYYFVQKLDEG